MSNELSTGEMITIIVLAMLFGTAMLTWAIALV